MKIWLLKRRGATWWANFPLAHQLPDGEYCDLYFYRKKDAVKYLKRYDGKYGNPFVVTYAITPPSKEDNRRHHFNHD